MSRLILAKRAYLLAVGQGSGRGDSASKIASVVLFDFAVEAVLKLAIEAFGSHKPAREFPAVLQQMDRVLSEAGLPPLIMRQAMLTIHDLRNGSQHQARYPNDTELAECLIYSRDALREIVRTVWDADFDSLSLSQLVRNSYARRLLEEAETALESGDWTQAVTKAAYALESSLAPVSNHVVGRLRHEVWRLEESSGESDLTRFATEVTELVEDNLVALSLGLDLRPLRRIATLTGRWVRTGPEVRYHHINPHLVESDAVFVFDTALAAVLKIEEQVGDLERPFGLNVWIEDSVDEFLTGYGLVRPKDVLLELPQTQEMSFDRKTVDATPRLRHARAVAALRRASVTLDPKNRTHAELLALVEQYIAYSDHYANDFDESHEVAAKKLLAAISDLSPSSDGP